MNKTIPLIIMGCGGVGRQLQHIVCCRSFHAKLGVHLRAVGVFDSKSLVIASDVTQKELDDNILTEVCRVKSDGYSLSKLTGIVKFFYIHIFVYQTSCFFIYIFIILLMLLCCVLQLGECQVLSNSVERTKVIGIAILIGKSTASSETIGVLKQGVDLGCCIVLANKKPLTSTLVVAGLPVISSINRIISSGDPIHRIVGSLSGTLGYVTSEVEDGKPLSQVVKSAKSLGYSEPDPRDDLSGMDVARKALILAQLLGRRIDLGSIRIESLYPEEMGPSKMYVEDFLDSGLVKLDNNIEERVRKASLNGNVLRYVCMIEGTSIECEVGIQELPKNYALGRLRGSDNVLEIYSRCYSQQPLVIQGSRCAC
ncbi:hypothetical protein CRYUN_Cryun02cG0198600 [Craigia yunnanensis]